MLVIEILIFSFALWLGAYLFSRNPVDLRLILAGVGLLAYAIGLSLSILATHANDLELVTTLLGWQKPLLILPALCWLLLLIHLLRGDESWYSRLQSHKNPLVVVLTATIFFGLGLSFLLFPLDWLPHNWLLTAIGFDLLLLGAAVAFLDAFDEGESLLPHMSRSFGFAFFVSLIFAGQIALVIVFNTGVTFAMLTLLLSTIAVAILFQTFSRSFQNLLDELVLRGSPQTYKDQATIRAAVSTVSRQNETLDLTMMDDPGFIRLTRRALSHMVNLPRLSASPLIRLPLVERRLQERGNPPDTLKRATELRSVLAESIARLRPEKNASFGTTDQWRHYNALYYPYVEGLKPYSRRTQDSELGGDSEQVLDWFRTHVPQRTLYNWQNEAARLVAQDLRERSWPAREQTPR